MKISALLTAALDDLELVENNDKYLVNMRFWAKQRGDICLVCLAGAYMVEHLDITGAPSDYPRYKNQLFAIDHLRLGEVYLAFKRMGIEMPQHIPRNWNVPIYGVDTAGFKSELRELASYLDSEGY